jgi:bacterioferritin (cytochrome b1)
VRELAELAEETEAAGIVLYPRAEEVDAAGLSAEELAQDIALLNEDLCLEYTVILQYIYQAFVVKDCAFSRTLLEDQGQESMKHMGWLAETIVDLGSLPVLEPGPIDPTTDAQAILALNLRLEHEAHDQYARHLEQLRHPLARAALCRIFEQESFHIQQFALLQQSSASVAAARPGSATPGNAAASPPPAGAPRPEGWPLLTVGSLYGQRQR